MQKILITLFAVVTLAVVADPRKSMLATRDDTTDTEPYNYWTWPTEGAVASAGPTSVWVPEIGRWYGRVAYNGYVREGTMGSFGEDWVSSSYSSGYSIGCFLELTSGNYIVSCIVDGKAQFRLAFYEATEGGYKWASGSILSAQSASADSRYERVFTVPEGTALVMLMPTSSDKNVADLTVTNIEIYRID